MALTVDTYRMLGRSGLRVSPLALGTATFGAAETGQRSRLPRSKPSLLHDLWLPPNSSSTRKER
ncbi:hypothetical protein [Nocardia transvalensis]|uniref:hypothetical protein n=1 Tax=Nocardia transvalensis TaxID=37333 RepID=UPI001895C3BD|nr:hypothetical protein [Nocardia transvalensis]MBF6328532.1 hypothetical protein [Nocardia transvalensis]